jgi:hypothetical protein
MRLPPLCIVCTISALGRAEGTIFLCEQNECRTFLQSQFAVSD